MNPGYKETEVGVIPDDWEVATISDVADKITVGFVGSMSHLFTRQGVPLLRGQNVLPNKLDLADTRFISQETHRQWKKSALQPGDVVMVRVGYPGTSCVIPQGLGEANAASLVVVRPTTKKVSAPFLSLVINSGFGKRQIDSYLVGGAQQVLNTATAAIFKLPVPTKAEQEAIAGALSDGDALIESLEQLVAKKRQLRQGAMQELLTGRKRLRGFSGEWEVKAVGEVGDCFAGGTPSTFRPEYWGGAVWWLPSGRVQNCILDCPSENETRITKRGLAESAAKLIKAHSVLVAITGATCANVACLEFEASANQSVVAIEPDSAVNYRFVYYSMLMKRATILSLQSGSAQGGVNLKAVKSIPLRLPSLPEQTAIAAILSDMDEEIAALEAKLAKTQHIKQGMMQELLTGRIRLV
jgi:type I restriction enzyme, S subunit